MSTDLKIAKARTIPKPTLGKAEIEKKGSPKRSQKRILAHHWTSLIAHLSSGQPLKPFLAQIGVNWETLHRALDQSQKHRETYARARKICVESYVSEIVPMSDAVIGEAMHVVTATRNAVDARKWLAGKLAPREYGDAPTVNVNANTTNVLVMSDEQLRSLQETRKRMLQSAPTLPAREA